VRWYVQSFSNRLKIASNFQAVGFEEKLPPQIETALYRILQEALNNIAKHSGAPVLRFPSNGETASSPLGYG